MLSWLRPQTAADTASRIDHIVMVELPAAHTACQTAADAEGDNSNAWAAADARREKLQVELRRLRDLHPRQVEREKDAADRAAAEAEQQRLAAEEADRQSRLKEAVADIARMRREAKGFTDPCKALAKSYAGIVRSWQAYSAKTDDGHFHGDDPRYKVDPKQWLIDELYRASDGELDLGASEDALSVTLARQVGDALDPLEPFARRVILEPAEQRPAIGDSYFEPVPYRPAWSEERPVYGAPLPGAINRRPIGWVTIEHSAQGTPPSAPEPSSEPVIEVQPGEEHETSANSTPAPVWSFNAEAVAASRALHWGPSSATHDSQGSN